MSISSMKCPHCLIAIHVDFRDITIGRDNEGIWTAYAANCPACKNLVIALGCNSQKPSFVRPFGFTRLCPPEVPNKYADDFKEACCVLSYSSKASAALSRRCLQLMLRDEAKCKHGNLSNEISEAIDKKGLPSHITDILDAIRNIGNFAAHPTKDTNTGEIIDVESEEADLCLDILESLFDYYFVAPATTMQRKSKLNEKLKQAGKPPIK